MRKPFFKAVVAGMASVAMIAGMSACGRSANNADSDSDAVKTIDSSKATGDLTIWAMGNEGDLLGDFVKGFEKENPDVKVKVTAIPWSSAHDKLQTAIAAGNGPDLAQMGTTWMADFSNSFSTVPDNLDMSDFSDGSRATGQVDGKQLGVPWYIDTRVLYYRTDIAEMAGWNKAPKTWNELKQMAKDMQKVDGVKYGMNLNPSGTDAFLGTLPFSYSAGASLTNKEQTKWTFEDTGIKKGLNFTTSLYKDGVANVNADVSSGADIANFVSGDTPMMLQGPTAVSQINDWRRWLRIQVRHRDSAVDERILGSCHVLRRRQQPRDVQGLQEQAVRMEVHPVGKQARGAGRMVQEVLRPARLSEGMG